MNQYIRAGCYVSGNVRFYKAVSSDTCIGKLFMVRITTEDELGRAWQTREMLIEVLVRNARGSLVVNALGYKPESRGFETR
jgi:hypothetical protein